MHAVQPVEKVKGPIMKHTETQKAVLPTPPSLLESLCTHACTCKWSVVALQSVELDLGVNDGVRRGAEGSGPCLLMSGLV